MRRCVNSEAPAIPNSRPVRSTRCLCNWMLL